MAREVTSGAQLRNVLHRVNKVLQRGDNVIINQVPIRDTYAEAFDFLATRVIITADTLEWAMEAARAAVGFGASIIGCGAECGIEGEVKDTPDGRPGVSILVFARTPEDLDGQLQGRVGMCVLTCPTTAAFNGLTSEKTVATGGFLRYFGDSYEYAEEKDGRRLWHVPMMDGEFIMEEIFGYVSGIGGGNFIIMGRDRTSTLAVAAAAAAEMRKVPNVILPFPGGVVRSGSRVGGANYDFLPAATNALFCPTLRPKVDKSLVAERATCVYEMIVDGLDMDSVKEAMKVGIKAACREGIVEITAGNYGDKLGKHRIRLYDVIK